MKAMPKNAEPMQVADYVELIRAAAVYDVAIKTPLEVAENLSSRLGNRILLKREDLQSVFSFKLRGAYNKLTTLSQDVDRKSVV
jgi:threonine dehydratase